MDAALEPSRIGGLRESASSSRTAQPASYKELTFPGSLQSIPSSCDRLMQFLDEHCRDKGDEIDLLIAFREALTNAALHGCGNDCGKQIHCSIEVDASHARIVIRDPGPGFDYETIGDPMKFDSTILEHGRGIALMRSVIDELTFAQGGSEIRLCKRWSC